MDRDSSLRPKDQCPAGVHNPPLLLHFHACRCVVAMRDLLGATMFLARLDPMQQQLVRDNVNVVMAGQEAAAARTERR